MFYDRDTLQVNEEYMSRTLEELREGGRVSELMHLVMRDMLECDELKRISVGRAYKFFNKHDKTLRSEGASSSVCSEYKEYRKHMLMKSIADESSKLYECSMLQYNNSRTPHS